MTDIRNVLKNHGVLCDDETLDDALIADIEKTLQAENAELKAQVAMLVDKGMLLSNTLHKLTDLPMDIYDAWEALDTALNQTQATAEAYKAELLKPWLDAVKRTGSKTFDVDFKKLGEALKATEGLM